ncbi:MAG: multidrug resistance protein [Chloroflexota bacterium]
MNTLLLISASVALSGIGQLSLRRGAMDSHVLTTSVQSWVALFCNGYILGGLLAWGVATLLWLVILSRTDLSFAYLLGSLNYIIVPLVSSWLFDEQLNRFRFTGMLVIFLGVLITLYGKYAEKPS